MAHNPGGGAVVKTASSWQVREPSHSRSIGHWKRYEPFIGILTQRLAHLS